MFKFCPKCGSKKGPFIKGFCNECFLKDNKLLDSIEAIEFQFCKRCNKIRVQRNWTEMNSIELIEFIKSRVKSKEFLIHGIEVKLNELNGLPFEALIEVKGTIEGHPLILNRVIKLKLVQGICDSCMKISSDYFEATLQARFNEKNSKKEEIVLLEFQKLISEMNKKDPLSRIVKTNKISKGFDLVLSSNRAARVSSEKLAKKYFSKVIRSFSVVGVDKTGKEKRRYTYCVRF